MKTTRRQVGKTLSALALAAASFGMAGNAYAEDTIKVGVLHSLSGTMASGALAGGGGGGSVADSGRVAATRGGGGGGGVRSSSGGRRQAGGGPCGVPMRARMFWACTRPCSAAAANRCAACASSRCTPRELVSIQARLYCASASP